MLSQHARDLINGIAKDNDHRSIEETKSKTEFPPETTEPAEIYSRLIYQLGSYFLETVNWRKNDAIRSVVGLAARYELHFEKINSPE